MKPRLLVMAILCQCILLESPLNAQTATNLDNIDLNDTVEDPEYVRLGDELAHTAATNAVGKPAPVTVLETIDGQKIDLGKLYGAKPVYLKFWATWCVPCRQQTPALEKVYKTMGDKIEVIAVNTGFSDDIASIQAFRKKFGMTVPIVKDDGRLGELVQLKVTPQHVLIGRDGRFAYIGHADDEKLAKAIELAINQAAAPLPAVKPGLAKRVYKLGDTVPDMSVTTTAGAGVPIAASKPDRLRGVVFFSSWCEWYLETSRPGTASACARVRQDVERFSGTDIGVDWLGVAGGPWAMTSDLADYQSKNKVSLPLSLDVSGDLFGTFGIVDIPTIVLVDQEGKIVRIIGPTETDIEGAARNARDKS